MKAVCGAKTRGGGTCQKPPLKGAKRCALHGGKTPVGADSPNLKHGRYSPYLKQSLQVKLATVRDDNPFDLLPELDVQRMLLADYMERFSEGMRLSANDIAYLMNWSAEIGKSVERIVRMKNETALTQAEVQFLATRVVELIGMYISEPDRREAFIRELFTSIPALTAGTE